MVNRKKSITIIIISYIVLLILTFVLCAFGSVKFGLKEILLSLFGNGNDLLNVIIYEIRLPRNLIAVLVGASLSVSGAFTVCYEKPISRSRYNWSVFRS